MTEKQKNWALGIITTLFIAVTALLFFTGYQLNEERHQLDVRDAQLQQLNIELGLAKSRLVEERELNKKYRDEISKFPDKLQKLIKEYELSLASRDETITKLASKIKGGTTTIVVKEPDNTDDNGNNSVSNDSNTGVVISYEWRDPYNRFHLIDPDIFTQNNETFTIEQYLRIKGWVFHGKNGRLQTKKIEIQELVPDGVNEDGSPRYRALDDVSATIVDSTFEYVDLAEAHKRSLLDIFTFRILATFDSTLSPGLGLELIDLGRYIDYVNVGLSVGTTFDVSNINGNSLRYSRLTTGLHYHFIPPLLDTNVALGLTIGVPLWNITHPVFALTATFYLTNPIDIRRKDE